jgi:hypothetical protein
VVPNLPAGPDTIEFAAEAWRGAPGGYRVGRTRSGVWWWVTPDGAPSVLRGVQRVQAPFSGAPGGRAILAQLDSWGFNALGAEAQPEFFGRGLPHLEPLELRRAAPATIRVGRAHVPDVFDPRWPEACVSRVATMNTARRDLIGYVSDSGLGWAQPPADGSVPARPTLLQLCLGLDPSFAAYHAAWEFVLAPRGGELAALNRAWGVALPNKETLRQLTSDEQPIATPGYLLDHARFTREFAQRYFRAAAAAVHQADPGRLFFGTPITGIMPAEVRESAAAHVDVLLTDTAPAGAGGGPVVVTDFDWTPFAQQEPASDEPPGLSALEQMHRRGREALEMLAAHPSVIGYLWGSYAGGERVDEAPFGRGLVYADGSIAHEHVQPLKAINARMTTIRLGR